MAGRRGRRQPHGTKLERESTRHWMVVGCIFLASSGCRLLLWVRKLTGGPWPGRLSVEAFLSKHDLPFFEFG